MREYFSKKIPTNKEGKEEPSKDADTEENKHSKKHPKKRISTKNGQEKILKERKSKKEKMTDIKSNVDKEEKTCIKKKTWTVPEKYTIFDKIAISNKGGRITYRFKERPNGRWHINLDGQDLGKYDNVKHLFFLKNGKSAVRIAKKGGRWSINIDNQELNRYDLIGPLKFSDDNKHFACIAYRNAKEIIVLDGQELGEYSKDEIRFLGFLDNGKHLIWQIRRESGEQFMVVDGMRQKEYRWIHSLTFSDDNKHFANISDDLNSKQKNNELVVIDGQEQKKYKRIEKKSIVFSANGRHCAYKANQNDQWFVVIDGKEQQKYDEIGTIVFFIDSKHCAYKAKQNDQWFVVIDGKEQPSYDQVRLIELIDNKTFAYISENKKREKQTIVLNGQEQKEADLILFFEFSPDKKRFMYVHKKGNKEYVVIDGQEQSGYDQIKTFSFSNDGKHFAYLAYCEKRNKWTVVLDGQELDYYDWIVYPEFLVDSEKGFAYLVYLVGNQDEQAIIFNGKMQKKYDYLRRPKELNDQDYYICLGMKDGKQSIIINQQQLEEHDRILNVKRSKNKLYLIYDAQTGHRIYHYKVKLESFK